MALYECATLFTSNWIHLYGVRWIPIGIIINFSNL